MAVRGLTREQAEAGFRPPTLSKAEWQAMHEAALRCDRDAMCRTAKKIMALPPEPVQTRSSDLSPSDR